MRFDIALQYLDEGHAVARAGWNGKNMFIYKVPAASYPAQTGVAKQHFGTEALVPYGAYTAIKGADGVVYPWSPSQQDLYAGDWNLVSL